MYRKVHAIIQNSSEGGPFTNLIRLIMMTINYYLNINNIMGAVMDLTRGASHDYVDSPFWSVFQIKAKNL